MAITKTITQYNETTHTRDFVGFETTYVGRVLKVYNREYRAMSDIYTLATFALVVEDDGTVREQLVNANFELDFSEGRAFVDADESAMQAWADHQAKIDAAAQAYAKAQREARELAEKNRPVVGKKMVVVKGRKVPKGTVGTVAFIHHNGGVLLKDDANWQDRSASGTWVNAGNLAAR